MNHQPRRTAQTCAHESWRCWVRLLFAGALFAGGSVMRAETPVGEQFRKDVEPILKEYCYDCHGDGAKKGQIAFDELTNDDSLLSHDLWFKVLKNTRANLMPPQKKPRPSAAEQQKIERWIKYAAFGLDPTNPDPGR